MKIQFGEKGEVPWDVLLEAVQNEQRQQESEPFQNRKSLCSRIRKRCCDSWLTLAILVSVVLAAQAWVLLYFTMGCASVYKPGGHVVVKDEAGKLRHVHFSWSSCGSDLDPVKLSKLRVSPDPVLIEGNITVDLNSYLGVNVDAPISADVKVERRLGWVWVEVPCIAGLGSCHYEDVCELVPFPPAEPCPDPFPRFKLPCRCPFTKGHYVVKDGVFNIPGILNIIPGWLVSGDYYVSGVGYQNGKRLGCYSVYASITD